MTDVLTEQEEAVPFYPMERGGSCPFDPANQLAALATEQPITRVRLWNGNHAWLVTKNADLRAAISDRRLSCDPRLPGFPHVTAFVETRRGDAPRTLIEMDFPEHTTYRRMLTKDFLYKRVEAMRPRIQEIVDGLIDRMLESTGPVDLVAAFALPVPSLVICELLGVPYDDHEFFQVRSNVLFARDATAEQAMKAFQELAVYLGGMMQKKAAQPGDDLTSRLVAEQLTTGAIGPDSLVAMLILLLTAGHETTANMISLSALTLLQHPEQMAELRDKPEMVPDAVEELLRYLTVAQSGARRVATEDIEIGGHLVKAGEGVILAFDTANRDTSVFAEPEVFDIHRDDTGQHVAFGFGSHQCVGQQLARAELQIAVRTLVQRVPTLRLAQSVDSLQFRKDMAVYGVQGLPVSW
ncbi:cytochrome P450 [Kitasatospora sp. NPDC090091]|uniref:cytochrome P450 n=1 Tax=Kitasatospora sp. NPDC090091 TaxID=3364081 RepID=UPI00380C08C0